jgi:hypothetical protein
MITQVQSALDSSPLLPSAALECRLVDGICYKDEVIALADHSIPGHTI